MADIRHLGIPEPESREDPQTKDEIIAAQQEQIELLEGRLRFALSLLNDPRRLTTRAIALLNGKRGMGFAFAAGLVAAYVFALTTPFDEALAGLVKRVFGSDPVATSPTRVRVERYPLIIYQDRDAPSPSPSPNPAPSASPPRTGSVPLPGVSPPPLPIPTPSVRIKHCPPPPDVPPRCLPLPSPSLPPL